MLIVKGEILVTHVDDISEKIASGRDVVIILGTGFSSAVADDPTNASWPGLLSAGVEYLETNGLFSNPVLRASIESDIEIGTSIDGSFLLSAGQKIASLMNRDASPHFAAFLRDTIGRLKVGHGKELLGEVIADLNVPVITTNYDLLFEEISNRPSATWLDARRFRSAITSQTADVVHLHGVWDNPQSVVLTPVDYETILHSSEVEALRQAIGVLKTIIFIGYGAGLNDPHFTQLWRFLKPLLAENVVHYTLCREQDLLGINQANSDNAIIPVAYGDKYEDLGNFLKQLAPPMDAPANTMGDARTIIRVAETCRLQILDQLADSTVIPRIVDNPNAEYVVDDLIVEPILLPVPPDQFATERTNGNHDLHRLDATSEVMNSGQLVVVGDEQSGVTTTLSWALMTRCGISPTHIPILLDYNQIGQGGKWVQNAVRKHLRASGAPISNREPLPSNLVVAIDNVTTVNERNLRRTIDDIKALAPVLVIYGCRPGVERALQSIIDDEALITIAYLGLLGRKQAIELAQRVVPDNAMPLADRVLRIASKEGLSRTPLSLILLIVGVKNDEGWINSVSNTTFVDSFVDSLLGRGGWRDDMRLQIDSGGYSRVLESFARKLINDDSVSSSWLDTVRYIEEIVRNLDWSDNAQDIVRSLISKGLFVSRDGRVKFRQSVYLHIFAARACRSDRGLLKQLLERPLYYSSIIRHYAALQRNDEEVLKWAVDLADGLDNSITPETGLYRKLGTEELIRDVERLDGLSADDDVEGESDNANSDSPLLAVESSGDGDQSSQSESNEYSEFDPYEDVKEVERDPFPASDLDKAAESVRLPVQLALISNVIRDSELVENAALKELGLRRVLSGWGLYMNHVHDSASVHRLIEVLVSEVGDRVELSADRRSELSSRLKEVWAVVAVSHLLAEELATIKLARALHRVLGEAAENSDLHMLLPAMLLERSMGPVEDYEGITKILIANRNIVGSRIFVDVIARSDYHSSRDASPDMSALERLIVDFNISLHSGLAGKRLGRARSRLIEYSRKRRTRARMRREIESRGRIRNFRSMEGEDSGS
ncbi:Uncharacterised protein [Mycobacteroides abscessus subsp. massiliense]|uniref:SIR2 family NAD-dependent protein deacylase n=1 Tax=Mycobacteroides abscessus TaxID=36809 RepID=UPI0009A5EFC8|nr:SIR2 family protein [Mycobacteroides abscessus]SKU29000.1 Uncharacterised protein [Mycobacteroides abscessus subsp. massiliense]